MSKSFYNRLILFVAIVRDKGYWAAIKKAAALARRTFNNAVRRIGVDNRPIHYLQPVDTPIEITCNAKCDVVIPVYNGLNWVKFCLDQIAASPDACVEKIILVNDRSDFGTTDFLRQVEQSHPGVILLENEDNLGFVGTSNRGLEASSADYVLLLNSDCLITPHTIPKLIEAAQSDRKIGLVSPISNNSPIVSLFMPVGDNFESLDRRLGVEMAGRVFDACTIVGSCLLITRACIDAIGLFDPYWGKGYGEETDYQFRAMESGFRAVIAANSYVYHKGGVSFTDNTEIVEHRKKNYDLFIEKWGDKYWREMKRYVDPIRAIEKSVYRNKHLPTNRTYDIAFVLPYFTQSVGGMTLVISIVNRLCLAGFNAVCIIIGDEISITEPTFFRPIFTNEHEVFDAEIGVVFATHFKTAMALDYFVNKKNLAYLIQGYEVFFENGKWRQEVLSSYELIEKRLCVSPWLSSNLEALGYPSAAIPFWVDRSIYYLPAAKVSADKVRLVAILRGVSDKGDWIVLDVFTRLSRLSLDNLEMTLIDNGTVSRWEMEALGVRIIRGPLSQQDLAGVFRDADVLLDASLHEGFGRSPIEAAACGCLLVCSHSGGNAVYDEMTINLLDGESIHPESYIRPVLRLAQDKALFASLREEARAKAQALPDMDQSIAQLIDYCAELDVRPSNRMAHQAQPSKAV